MRTRTNRTFRKLANNVLRATATAVMAGVARAFNVRFQVTVLHRSSDNVDWADTSSTGSSERKDLVSLIDARAIPAIPDAQLYLPQPRNPRQPLVFSPWYGAEEFENAFRSVKHLPGTSRDRCYLLRAWVKHALPLDGDVAECGVWRGKTAFLIAEAVRGGARKRVLHLFDTFEGIPEPDPEKDRIPERTFDDTSLEEVQTFLASFDFLEFHKGDLAATLQSTRDKRFCFVHVDVDHYSAILECCDFFYPRMVVGGVMVFDDYGFPSTPAAREAVDTFFESRPEAPVYLPSGQCVVIKHSGHGGD